MTIDPLARVVDMPGANAHRTPMFYTTLQVALGGAIGASLRFLAGVGIFRLTGPGFPLAILSVNILGSFLMGVSVVFAAKTANTHLSPFVMTGLLGGFTTFSAFLSRSRHAVRARSERGRGRVMSSPRSSFRLPDWSAGVALARGLFA